jgi:Zn-dependent M28 family amino/carboxypeptidase
MAIKRLIFFIIALASANSHCNTLKNQLIEDFNYLASDELMGRQTASQGAKLSREYLMQRLSLLDLEVTEQYFTYKPTLFKKSEGINIVAQSPKKLPKVIITAHYDHLGKRNGKLHLGANDNASGVAAVLYLAASLHRTPLPFELVFVFTDAEENGLHGSLHFAESINPKDVIMNINLDMLGVKERNKRLYALTSYSLKPHLQPIFSDLKNIGINLKPAYSSKQMNRLTRSQNIDWHRASDHYSFARNNIPYVYFGMGHDSYNHTAKDTMEHINIHLYINTVTMVEAFIKHLAQVSLVGLKVDT